MTFIEKKTIFETNTHLHMKMIDEGELVINPKIYQAIKHKNCIVTQLPIFKDSKGIAQSVRTYNLSQILRYVEGYEIYLYTQLNVNDKETLFRAHIGESIWKLDL